MKRRLQQSASTTPMTSPLPMPPLLLQLLLLHLISLTLAQTSDSISPSPSNDTFTAEVALEHGTNRNFTITAAKASNLLAEFVISRPSSADLVAEGLPFLLLAAAVSPSPTLVATSGTAAAAESDAHQDYKCTKSLPCLRKGEGIDVDDEAFFTRADRAAVRLNGLKEGASVVVQVHNFDREHKLGDERKLKPGMKGTIRVRAVTEEEERQCAGYDPEEGEEERNVCSGNGKCKERVKCTCETGFGGPLCESKVLPMDREDLPLPVLDEPPGGWLHPPIGDGAVEVSVPAFTRNVFSWEQRGGDSRVHVQALVMSGFAPEGTKGDAVSDTRVRMYAKTPRENGNIYLKNGPQLPSEYDFGRRCTLMRVRDGNHPFVFGFSCYRKEVVKNETNLLIAIYADATGGKGKEPRPAAVSFRVLRCDVDDVKCPTVDTVNANISIPIAVLPVCIATIGITALAIGVMLWLDRQHGFTSSVDRLSQKELDRMYPTEKFRVPQEPRREASGDQETDECLICLSKFEQNEVLRRLHCEHIYHSECLDPWLTQNNASCPACRSNVRIQNLSDRRRLRRLVTFCLWPIVWLRNLRARRSGDDVEYEEGPGNFGPPDVEAGLARPVAVEQNGLTPAVQQQEISDTERMEMSATEPSRLEGVDDLRPVPEIGDNVT